MNNNATVTVTDSINSDSNNLVNAETAIHADLGLVKQFQFYAPTVATTESYIAIQNKAIELASLYTKYSQSTPERASALNRLKESTMWASFAIAKNSGSKVVSES